MKYFRRENSSQSNQEVIMCFKKIAMLVLTFGLVSGVMVPPVSASAKEDQAVPVSVESNVNTEADQTDENTSEKTEVNDISATATPVPTKTPVESEKTVEIKTSVKKAKKTVKKKKAKKKAKKTVKKKKYKKSDLRLMASIINCEAGGESYQGQLAVGIVVMNRVKSKAFPNTIRKVIFQRGQFSPVRNGSLRKKLDQYDAGRTGSAQWKSCIRAAKKVLTGQDTIKLRGRTKSMKGVRFFSVGLSGAKFRLGGHRFK